MTNTKQSAPKRIGNGLVEVQHQPDPSVDPQVYSMDPTIISFLSCEPFLAQVFYGLINASDWSCDTAYVGVPTGSTSVRLGWNPDFMRQLTMFQRHGVLKHELYHVIFNHLTDRRPGDPTKRKLYNVAQDLAINSIIVNGKAKGSASDTLPEFALLPGVVPQGCTDAKVAALFRSLPLLQSAEFYVSKLEEFNDQNNNGSGQIVVDMGAQGTLDDHDGWGEIPEEIKDVLRETISQAIEQGVKAIQNGSSWGSIPESLQQELIARTRHVVDWKSVVRNFAARCRSSEMFGTVKKLNKRAPYLFPGVRRSEKARLLWAIDQSGSMSDEDVGRGLAEAFGCGKATEIDVVNFDTEVDESSFFSVKNGRGFQWKRTRCGGTNFDCVRRFVAQSKNKGRWTGVVIMTDGYAPEMGRTALKVLWLVTPTGSTEGVRNGDLLVKMDTPKPVLQKK